jgi:large subunit ribosomal protein L38
MSVGIFQMEKFSGQLTPAGLAFFQSDYDSSVKKVFHDLLDMREPRWATG